MSENTNQSTKTEPSITDIRWRLKNGEIIPETEFQRRSREFRELWIEGNKVDALLSLRGELEATVMSADQTLLSPEKEANQIRIMYRTLDKLCQYFMDWENARQRYMDWKRSIEAELRKAVQEQTQVLQAVEDKLDELLNGKPQGQSEMFNLLLSTLSDLRERIATLEALPKSRPSAQPRRNA